MELQRIGQHHSFDVDLATELKSIDLAVLVHHFQFWIRLNAATDRHFHDERFWTYQTLKDIAAHFPYWSIKQVERLLNKLVELEILVKGNYNATPYDRTVWYAFKDEARFCISRNREMEETESGNQNPEIGKPIPDTLPYSKASKKKKKSAALASIHFDYDSKAFVNIELSDLEDWKSLFPNADIDHELKKMRQWLLDPDNPERDGNRTFITNWLSKAQKEQSRTPKKLPLQEKRNLDEDRWTFDLNTAYGVLTEEGVNEYVEYLKYCTNKKYYHNHMEGKYLDIFANYMKRSKEKS